MLNLSIIYSEHVNENNSREIKNYKDLCLHNFHNAETFKNNQYNVLSYFLAHIKEPKPHTVSFPICLNRKM